MENIILTSEPQLKQLIVEVLFSGISLPSIRRFANRIQASLNQKVEKACILFVSLRC